MFAYSMAYKWFLRSVMHFLIQCIYKCRSEHNCMYLIMCLSVSAEMYCSKIITKNLEACIILWMQCIQELLTMNSYLYTFFVQYIVNFRKSLHFLNFHSIQSWNCLIGLMIKINTIKYTTKINNFCLLSSNNKSYFNKTYMKHNWKIIFKRHTKYAR